MAVIRAAASWFVAFICDLTYGASGGFVDLSDWRTELERTATRVAELEEIVNPAPRPFEAYTDCPKCGHMDYHRMREPSPYSRREVEAELARATRAAEEAEDRGQTDDRLTMLLQHRHRYIELLTDHSGECRFETIRICTKCGHEWGML